LSVVLLLDILWWIIVG